MRSGCPLAFAVLLRLTPTAHTITLPVLLCSQGICFLDNAYSRKFPNFTKLYTSVFSGAQGRHGKASVTWGGDHVLQTSPPRRDVDLGARRLRGPPVCWGDNQLLTRTRALGPPPRAHTERTPACPCGWAQQQGRRGPKAPGQARRLAGGAMCVRVRGHPLRHQTHQHPTQPQPSTSAPAAAPARPTRASARAWPGVCQIGTLKPLISSVKSISQVTVQPGTVTALPTQVLPLVTR